MDLGLLPTFCFPRVAQALLAAVILLYFVSKPPHLKTWLGFRRGLMPPGPHGWPIVGSLVGFLRARHDSTKMAQWLNTQAQYGEMTTLHMGTKTWVLLNTERVVTEIYAKRAALTHERPYLPIAGGLVSQNKRIFFAKSEKWREGRHLMHQVLTGSGMKDHPSLVEYESVRLLQNYLQSPRQWYAHNYRYCIAIMYTIVTGETLEAIPEDLAELLLTTSFFIQSIHSSFVDFFPAFDRLPTLLQFWRRHWNAIGQRHYQIIQRWWKSLDRLKQPDAAPSFIRDSLLQCYKERDDEAMYLGMSLTTAGGDNPRKAMNAWFMSCLAAPDALVKARMELDSVCTTGSVLRLPNLDDLPACPYTSAVVKEVLRWRPVVPLSPQRMIVEEMNFEGYCFPAGTEFLINGSAVGISGHDQPDEFLPERWLDYDGNFATSVAQDLWTYTFSGGRRACVGYKLAQKELFVAFARIIYCFFIKPAGQFDDTKLNTFSQGEPFPVEMNIRSEAFAQLIRHTAEMHERGRNGA